MQFRAIIIARRYSYRGITGRRDVVFANVDDLEEAGLSHCDLVDIIGPGGRRLTNMTLVAHAMARGPLAAYFPEANGLIALEDVDALSGTPSYKSIPVEMVAVAAPATSASARVE